jgi:hypothetical protein
VPPQAPKVFFKLLRYNVAASLRCAVTPWGLCCVQAAKYCVYFSGRPQQRLQVRPPNPPGGGLHTRLTRTPSSSQARPPRVHAQPGADKGGGRALFEPRRGAARVRALPLLAAVGPLVSFCRPPPAPLLGRVLPNPPPPRRAHPIAARTTRTTFVTRTAPARPATAQSKTTPSALGSHPRATTPRLLESALRPAASAWGALDRRTSPSACPAYRRYVNGLEATVPAGWNFWGGFSSSQGTYN